MGTACVLKKQGGRRRASLKETLIPTHSIIPEENLPEIFDSGRLIRWKLGELLSETRFSKTYQCIDLKTGELLILKSYRIIRISSNLMQELKKVRREANIIRSLNHPSLLRFFQIQFSNDSINILSECIPSGCLTEILNHYRPLEESIIKSYLKQILEAIDYLNHQGISHNNICSKSIYITSQGLLKLKGFKNYTTFNGGNSAEASAHTKLPERFIHLSPEALSYNPHPKSDIWSIGCLAIELLTGTSPFSHLSKDLNQLQKLLKNSHIIDANSVPDGLREIVESCLKLNPDERPSAKELLSFEFFRELKQTNSCIQLNHNITDDQTVNNRNN